MLRVKRQIPKANFDNSEVELQLLILRVWGRLLVVLTLPAELVTES